MDEDDDTFMTTRTIKNQNVAIPDGLKTVEMWDGIRGDSRFNDMIKLLDAKEVHTAESMWDFEKT